jgi:hypothetical protein
MNPLRDPFDTKAPAALLLCLLVSIPLLESKQALAAYKGEV